MYNVRCVQCGTAFDAVAAPECSCAEEVRSVRCPSCDSCFCKTDRKFRDAFWQNAPPEMVARRPSLTVMPQYPEPDKVRRPLVLFADDDPTSRAIAQRTVQALGFGIIVARNGADLIDLARTYKPELVVTDALMPQVDGREAARTIKSELPNTRVILITSVYKSVRYRNEAIGHFGVDEYLTKPIAPGDLKDAIEKQLR